MDPYLSTWYKSNSLIYVSHDHACWSDDDSARKVKKQRFGNVLMADIEVGRGPDNVGRMLKRFVSFYPHFSFPSHPLSFPFPEPSQKSRGDHADNETPRYEEESAMFINQKVEDWERDRGDMDPDETEDEAEAEAEAGAQSLADQGLGMQGVVQSFRVPVA